MNMNLNLDANSILRSFLQSQLEDLEPNWWSSRVISHLSYRNQDRAWKMGPSYLAMMDLSETLKVLKGNWNTICEWNLIDDRAYGLLCHLTFARNAMAHACCAPNPAYESYDRMALEILVSIIDEIDARNAA